jgi:hypothetical protein
VSTPEGVVAAGVGEVVEIGSIWLDGRTGGYPNIFTVLQQAGIQVEGYQGWQTRSRSSGGFEKFLGIVCHHTASKTTAANDLNYMVYGSSSAPVSNGLLDRTGKFTVIAAGASNHAGKGGGSSDGGGTTWVCSKGTVPANAANSYCFGIEAANNGIGEPWPEPQQDAYTRMVAAICKAYGFNPATDIRAHQEWTPPRKCDPTGPARFCTDNNKQGCNGQCLWRMNSFRTEVQSLMAGPGPLPTPGTGKEEAMIIWQDIRYLNAFNMTGPTHMDGYLMGGLYALRAEGHHYMKGLHDQTLAGLCREVFGVTGANDAEVIQKSQAGGFLAPNGNYNNDLAFLQRSGGNGTVW